MAESPGEDQNDVPPVEDGKGAEHHRTLKKWFAEMVDLPRIAREQRLAELRRERPALAEELLQLLAADEMGTSALDGPVRVHERIGPYRILDTLGHGGMGEVYLAEQLTPVRREVALKLVRSGLDSHEIAARFETERQALALMNHHGIARVYDAGTTDGGRPYFAMEYVRGLPITDYADERRLTPDERIHLFLQVGDAIEHAHQKGILHRDLKPSNLLVGEEDGRPVVKVIDFGIAKALAQPLTERTLHTQHGRLLGTPEYMSPEQASTRPLDVDTRTDVYSLGVLLYELLVGVRPLSDTDSAGTADVLRRLSTLDPTRPSQRLDDLAGNQEALASLRRVNVTSWKRRLRGDLDWILLRALERDRTARYDSVAEFSSDLRRHLRHEPVVAGPPSTAYRLRKFVRRHRSGVAATAVVVVALIASLIGVALALQRAKVAEKIARAEADAAEEVAEFLVDTFRLSDPIRRPGQPVSAGALLAESTRRLREAESMRPLTRARLMQTLSDVYVNLGEYENAHIAEEALALLREELNEGRPEVAIAKSRLGSLYQIEGELEKAKPLLEDATVALRGAGPRFTEDLAETLGELGSLRLRMGEFAEADQYFREAIALIQADDPNSFKLVGQFNNLGLVAFRRGDYAEALPSFEKALSIARQHFPDTHPTIASLLNNLGGLNWALERYDEAAPYLRRSLAIRQQTLAPGHPDIASAMSNLGEVESMAGNFEEAERLFTTAVQILREGEGDELLLANPAVGMGLLYRRMGRLEDSEAKYLEALDIQTRSLGERHPELAEVWKGYAGLLAEMGRAAESETAAKKAAEIEAAAAER